MQESSGHRTIAGRAWQGTVGMQVIEVVAGVLRDAEGRWLLAERPAGKAEAGCWEFPGGKREPGESLFDALARELHEELGLSIHSARQVGSVFVDRPGRSLRLQVLTASAWSGVAQGREGQRHAWVRTSALLARPMPAADRPIVRALALPEGYAITPSLADQEGPDASTRFRSWCAAVDAALASGVGLISLRDRDSPRRAEQADFLLTRARAQGAIALLHGDPQTAMRLGFDGVHLSHAALMATEALPECLWRAASCHDPDSLRRATALGCDLVTLSPVRPSASHPGSTPLTWAGFEATLRAADLWPDQPFGFRPRVYALGGLGPGDLDSARRYGAHGVAGISGWRPAA